MPAAICMARMLLPTLESANRQPISPSYQNGSKSGLGFWHILALSIAKLASTISSMPALRGASLPACSSWSRDSRLFKMLSRLILDFSFPSVRSDEDVDGRVDFEFLSMTVAIRNWLSWFHSSHGQAEEPVPRRRQSFSRLG